jgi:hypothetical protein
MLQFIYKRSLTRFFSQSQVTFKHLKPVGAAKLKESSATTPTNQNTNIAPFLSSPNP